jgi:hypothetical protein
VRDVTVYLTYPDGSQSANFNVTIVQPSTTSLSLGYPQDSIYDGLYGYQTTYDWNLTDTCGNSDPGLDANEAFGAWTDVYVGNAWGYPTGGSDNFPTSTVSDVLRAGYKTTPPSTNPQSPLSTEAVEYDFPWDLFVGSLTSGSGVVVHSDYQVFFVDHGRHQVTY